MVETVRNRLSTQQGAANKQEQQEEQRIELVLETRMDNIRQRIKVCETSILKDVDRKLNALADEIVDELKKEATKNSEFKHLFSEDNEHGNAFKRKSTKNGILPEKEFMPRNSLLTDLVEVKHIRTIYHIFICIMSLLFLNTIMYDLVEGRINIGVSPIIKGFRNFHYALLIWSIMQLCTFLVYPTFVSWANIRLIFPKGIRAAFDYSSALFFVLYLFTLTFVVTKANVLYDLAPASAVALLMELTRFLMKTYAFVRSNVPSALLPKDKTKNDKAGFYVPEFKKFVYFLFVPTLVYRHQYPRTTHIRWRFIAKCLMEIVGIIFFVSFLFERFVIDEFSDSRAIQLISRRFVLQIFGCMVPGIMLFVCAFYLLLHSWCNTMAELLQFADRMFYQDWWTMTSYPDYYRTWNIVVHDWLYTYVYKDCYERVFKGSKLLSMLAVFTVSSVVHEYIIAFTFHFFYPVMFVLFQGCGVFMMFLTKNAKNNLGNIFLWWSLTVGNGIMMALYAQEFNARKNCPVGDSIIDYIVPVSWYCQGVKN